MDAKISTLEREIICCREIAERDGADYSALKAKYDKCVAALELCHKRMKHTAWVEDECFDAITEVLNKDRGE